MSETRAYIARKNGPPGVSLAEILRRPEATWADLERADPSLAARAVPLEVQEEIGIEEKYAGYIRLQGEQVERVRRLEEKRIRGAFDYEAITALRKESRAKLTRHRPASIAEAARIAGVTPADIGILLVHLRR